MTTEPLSDEAGALSLGPVRVSPLFATPLVELSLPEAGDLCAALRERLLAVERHVRESMPGRSGVVEGSPDLFLDKDPALQAVAMLCSGAVARAHAGLFEADEKVRVEARARLRVTHEGGYRPVHRHEGDGWVGLFCVDPGWTAAPLPQTGLLRLHAPSWENTMWQDALNRRWARPHALGPVDRRLLAGDLLAWPAWIPCEVFPHHGSAPRVEVLFECHVRAAEKGGVS